MQVIKSNERYDYLHMGNDSAAKVLYGGHAAPERFRRKDISALSPVKKQDPSKTKDATIF